ncbi:MAG: hypothetical protein IAE99_12140 [Rhodothermales bacterium]|nr:hypothetical protein [Rhodothermales bacterium]
MKSLLYTAALGAALLGCDAADPEAETYMRGTLEGRSWSAFTTSSVVDDSVEFVRGKHDFNDSVCSRQDPCAILSFRQAIYDGSETRSIHSASFTTYQQDALDVSVYAGKPTEWPVRDEAQNGTIRCFTTGGPLYRDLRFAKRHALPDTITFRDLRVCYDTASTG